MIKAVVIFILMSAGLLRWPHRRCLITVSAAVFFVLLGIVNIQEAFEYIRWNVLFVMTGTMVVARILHASRLPERMARKMINIVPSVRWALVVLCLCAGLLSAFVDNVAAVLLVVPVGIEAARQLKTNPVRLAIAIAVSCNLQGTATLIGDETSMLLSEIAGMQFSQFFWMNNRIGIGIITEIGVICTIPVLFYIFRKEHGKVIIPEQGQEEDRFPAFLLGGMIAALVIVSPGAGAPSYASGLVCMIAGIYGLLYEWIKFRDKRKMKKIFKALDWKTPLFIAALFVVVAGMGKTGVLEKIADLILYEYGDSVFVIYTAIFVSSVVLSCFVDNIPYTATMFPVIWQLADKMEAAPYVFYFGLIIGTTLGGNLTRTGSSANAVCGSLLEKEGYQLSVKDYFSTAFPIAFAAGMAEYMAVWLIRS